MYKNQLQELAQRSCFNLPSYTCIREGPDHAPRFKATVNFNGEVFESPNYCSTLRQAEHSAAEVALNALANRGPSNSLAARILDETGVYKNLLQEVSQRVGASLPAYTTFRSGLGHLPVFTCTVELAGVTFTGEPAKNKKQAEKNAAMAAWSSLKLLAQQSESSRPDRVRNDEQEHVTVARALQRYIMKARLARASFPIKFPTPNPRPSSVQQLPSTTSKLLPLICPRTVPRSRPVSPLCLKPSSQSRSIDTTGSDAPLSPRTAQTINNIINDSFSMDSHRVRPEKFPAAGAAPYIPVGHFGSHHRMAPPVTIRNSIPVFSAPPPPQSSQSARMIRPPGMRVAPPVCIRQAVPVYAAPPVRAAELPTLDTALQVKEPTFSKAPPVQVEEPLASKAPEIQVHEIPTCQAVPGKAELPHDHSEEQPFAQVQPTKRQEPIDLEVSRSATMPVEATEIATEEKLHESQEIEKLKQLKI
ncbi:double-stranded RNA-binding protein 2-like isoform X1 [Lycium barbarum]|uniref:double-stranded RNA-binding protein 2-like isoform X1 n=1 Tax=Lycium barbarum TaxID=112863 RepID=UPI00293F4268|nr:double-stranded RNA-binding protein 2-like isoform X1 [Lycium barbarum]